MLYNKQIRYLSENMTQKIIVLCISYLSVVWLKSESTSYFFRFIVLPFQYFNEFRANSKIQNTGLNYIISFI